MDENMSESKIDLFSIQAFSTKILTIKKILKDKLKHTFLYLEKKYILLIESYKYINLLKKIAKENNLTINKNADHFGEIILNEHNNLNSIYTDQSRTLSIIHSSIFNSNKIQGMDSSSICRTMNEITEEFHRGFILKKYSHDKGYRYLKYIKIYNTDGVDIRLDISTDKVKIIDIDNFYYQERFDTIVIVGKQLTYDKQVNCDYVIKVFTLSYLLKTWFDLCETKTNSLRKTWKYKLDFNEIVELDTIVVSELKELKDVKYIYISIDKDGLYIREEDIYNSNPVKLYIRYYYDSRVIENKTINEIVNPIDRYESLEYDTFIYRLCKLGFFDEKDSDNYYVIDAKIEKVNNKLNVISSRVNKIEEAGETNNIVFSFYNKLFNIFNKFINPDIDYSKYMSSSFKEKKFTDTRSIGLTNNNYNS